MIDGGWLGYNRRGTVRSVCICNFRAAATWLGHDLDTRTSDQRESSREERELGAGREAMTAWSPPQVGGRVLHLEGIGIIINYRLSGISYFLINF